MSNYEESVDDLIVRIMATQAINIMKRFKVGDYLTITKSVDNYDDDGNPGLFFENNYLDEYDFLSDEDVDSFKDTCYESDDDGDSIKEKLPKIKTLFKVIEVVNDIPIVQEVDFPGAIKNHPPQRRSLLLDFHIFLNDFTHFDMDDEDAKKILLANIDRFAQLDPNYADSIILEHEYVPYENVKEEINKFFVALQGTLDEVIEDEFHIMMRELEKSDLSFARKTRTLRRQENWEEKMTLYVKES